MERETRFELATLALARRCSTTELLPQSLPQYTNHSKPGQDDFPICTLHALRCRPIHPVVGCYRSMDEVLNACRSAIPRFHSFSRLRHSPPRDPLRSLLRA